MPDSDDYPYDFERIPFDDPSFDDPSEGQDYFICRCGCEVYYGEPQCPSCGRFLEWESGDDK